MRECADDDDEDCDLVFDKSDFSEVDVLEDLAACVFFSFP